MTREELNDFRDEVATPSIVELFTRTQIPEGACYIDNVAIKFLDGRSCGVDSQMTASGLLFLNGEIQRYQFEELDIDLRAFAEAHKNCVFISDGKLEVVDEVEELTLITTIRNMNRCEKIFHQFANMPKFEMAFSPVAYHKMLSMIEEVCYE